jgi:predicted DNA binding protein
MIPKVESRMFEVSFRVQHACPYVRFSLKHPEVRIVEWCNHRMDVLEIECPDIETFTRIEDDLQNLISWGGSRVLKKSFFERNLQVIIKTCREGRISPSVSTVLEENACLEIPPIVYHGGWEERRAVGFRESDYKKTFRILNGLGQVEILRKKVLAERSIRDSFVISLSSVFSELTQKQVNALLSALDYGYYQVPKRLTAEEIARKHRVPRTTYEEHVRKAESKILRAMAPYVRIYASSGAGPLSGAPEITTT